MIKLGLQPIIGPNPRILILGSLPGDESLRKQEYYGNPRNMFWDVMSGWNQAFLTERQRRKKGLTALT